MAFINKKNTDKKSDFKNCFKNKNRPEGDDDEDNKKKFDDKPAPSDEDDDNSRRGKSNFKNKFKKDDDDEDRDDDKDRDRFKGRDDDDDEDDDEDDKGRFVTKDMDRDDDDTEKSDFDKKRGDRDEDDDEDKGGKKAKGGCNCGRQIEVNPPLRTQYEAIEALPDSLKADAIAALAEQEVAKILDALEVKANEHEIDYDILFEVFRRGWFSGRGSDHLSEAEIGFNRVSSFLAGGLARKLDADLLDEDMGINTPSDDMVCDHDEPTPGEKLKNKLRKKRK